MWITIPLHEAAIVPAHMSPERSSCVLCNCIHDYMTGTVNVNASDVQQSKTVIRGCRSCCCPHYHTNRVLSHCCCCTAGRPLPRLCGCGGSKRTTALTSSDSAPMPVHAAHCCAFRGCVENTSPPNWTMITWYRVCSRCQALPDALPCPAYAASAPACENAWTEKHASRMTGIPAHSA